MPASRAPRIVQALVYPALACLALVAMPARLAADEPVFFLLTAQNLSCLKSHAQDYAPQGDETSFITVADCGSEGAGTGSLLDQVLNSAPDMTIVAEDGPDPVVALTAEDFACLERLDIPEQEGLLAFFPEACNVEPRN